MNPPPIPESESKNWAHHAASASLLTPVIAIVFTAIVHATNSQSAPRPIFGPLVQDLGALLLILAGLGCSIIAWCGIFRFGTKRILGRSVSGFICNGLFLMIFATNFFAAQKKAQARAAYNQDIRETAQNAKNELAKSYDPELGITNNRAGMEQINRAKNQLQNAARNATGNEAVVMQTLANHVQRLQTSAKNYETAAESFQSADVFTASTLKQKTEIDSQRQTVRKLLSANDELKRCITDAEKNIRTELEKKQASPAMIESTLKGFRGSSESRNRLIVQIRDRDKQMGEAALSVLNLLESDWGHWHYDAKTEVALFEKPASQEKYADLLDTANTAVQEQVKLQGQLVKQR